MRRRLLHRLIAVVLIGAFALGAHHSQTARAQEAPPPTFTRLDARQTALVLGKPLRASAEAAVAGGTDAPVTWDFGDGSAPVVGGAVEHSYAASGLYTVTLSAAVDGGAPAIQSFRVVVAPKPSPQVPTAVSSDTKAIPFQFVGLFGTFATGVPTVVEFRFGKTGLVVTPTVVTASMVRVAVPPLLKGAAFSGGKASVRVIQGSGAAATFTYAGTIQVGKLPRVKLPAGEATKSFIRLARGVLTDARDLIEGSAVDTPEHADTIESTLNLFDALEASVDAGVSSKRATVKAVIAASEFDVALSGATVRQMDTYAAGVVAAGARNAAEPETKLVYEALRDAMGLTPSDAYDPALRDAEAAYRDHVRLSAEALTDGLNTITAPLSTTTAVLGLTGLATGNPVVIVAAAKLAVCTDVLTGGLILGLGLDAAYAALSGDPFYAKVYLESALQLSGEFATGKALGRVVRLAKGEAAEELFGQVRDIAGAAGVEFLSFQSIVQPLLSSDATLTVGDAVVVEGNSGGRDLVFTVQLSSPSARTVSVKCATTDGTASAGRDYDRLDSTTLTFAPGDLQRTLAVRVSGDRAREDAESLFVKLSAASGAPVVRGLGTGSILDDDWSLLVAESGSGDFLGTATGCGLSASLYLDPSVEISVTNDGMSDPECTVSAPAYTPEYGANYYEWQGTLIWNGDALTGTLPRTSNPNRPPAEVTITFAPDGRYLLTASLPFTSFVFLTDGSCTGSLHTFTYGPEGVEMESD